MASGIPIPKEKDNKKKGLPSLSSLQKKADGFLTPIMKIVSPMCEACGGRTEVAHHWIEKSRSARLRYYLKNLVGLCHSCHCKIHNKFGNSIAGCLDTAQIIIEKRGGDWKNQMTRMGHEEIKVNREHYNRKIEQLSGLLENLQKATENEAVKSLVTSFNS